jgi:hypothetical protein
VRKAEDQTGVKASEFSRIRNAHLERFTVDRLMNIINRLHCRIDVKVSVKLMPPLLHGQRILHPHRNAMNKG